MKMEMEISTKYKFNLYLAFSMLASSICLAANLQAAESSAPSSRYMGGPAELVTAPNGAIVNKEVLEQLPKISWTDGPEIEDPVKGVYVLGGYLISACIVVEAEEGLIVFDTGDTREDGEKLLKAIRTISDKPIKAIVYGHTHYVFGAGVMAEGNKDIILCERGIVPIGKGKDYTRYILDLAAVPVIKKESYLPIIVDPSHATGRRDLIFNMSCAAIAAGASGLMIEVHYNPAEALVDGQQMITPDELGGLISTCQRIHKLIASEGKD